MGSPIFDSTFQTGRFEQTDDGVTRKDVESWMRYFDEHAEEFVAAHEAIIRKARKSDAQQLVTSTTVRITTEEMEAAHKEGRMSYTAQHSDAEPVADIDLAIEKVLMFRLERMDDNAIWIRLYRENGDDKVIWLNSTSAITATVVDDKDAPHRAPEESFR